MTGCWGGSTTKPRSGSSMTSSLGSSSKDSKSSHDASRQNDLRCPALLMCHRNNPGGDNCGREIGDGERQSGADSYPSEDGENLYHRNGCPWRSAEASRTAERQTLERCRAIRSGASPCPIPPPNSGSSRTYSLMPNLSTGTTDGTHEHALFAHPTSLTQPSSASRPRPCTRR